MSDLVGNARKALYEFMIGKDFLDIVDGRETKTVLDKKGNWVKVRVPKAKPPTAPLLEVRQPAPKTRTEYQTRTVLDKKGNWVKQRVPVTKTVGAPVRPSVRSLGGGLVGSLGMMGLDYGLSNMDNEYGRRIRAGKAQEAEMMEKVTNIDYILNPEGFDEAEIRRKMIEEYGGIEKYKQLFPDASPNQVSGRLDDPIAGKGPQSNQVGSEVNRSTWRKPRTQEESLEPGEKINENGIKQKGRDLSSSTLGRQMLLEVPEGPDANSFIQSEGPTSAPGAGLNLNMPGVSAESFYKQPPVPFQIADEAGPKFAMEMSPESLKPSENAFSTDMTKYTPLLTNIQETEAKKEEPKPSRQRGSARQQEFAARPGNQPFGGEEPATADLVSPMYANAARNAARSGFLDAPISEGPMGRIRRRNAAVGLNAAGNIAKIDGKLYNVTKDQAYALTGGAGNTREGLDAIKNAATLYVAPGTQSPGMQVDTSNLTPGAKAAVDLAMSGPKPFTTQDMNDQNAGERLDQFNLLKVDTLSPAEQATYNAAMSSPTSFTTQGMNKENSGEYIDRFVDMNTQGMTPPDAEEFRKRFMSALQTRS